MGPAGVSSVPYCVRSEPDSRKTIRGGSCLLAKSSGVFSRPPGVAGAQIEDYARGILPRLRHRLFQYCLRFATPRPSPWSFLVGPISSKESYGVGSFLATIDQQGHRAYRTNNRSPESTVAR